jgi:hypothetical protein
MLRIIEAYPFPKPQKCTRTNQKLQWLDTKISAFTSEKLLKYIDGLNKHPEINQLCVDDISEGHVHLSIAQNQKGSGLSLSNIRQFLSIVQVKSLFVELLLCHSTCFEAICSPDISELLGRNFTDHERLTKTIMSWLQYFDKDGIEKRGGFAAFESNPYVQTQRIHHGLLVQVGENPNVFDTPEGEQLLVNAINALPSLKH